MVVPASQYTSESVISMEKYAYRLGSDILQNRSCIIIVYFNVRYKLA